MRDALFAYPFHDWVGNKPRIPSTHIWLARYFAVGVFLRENAVMPVLAPVFS